MNEDPGRVSRPGLTVGKVLAWAKRRNKRTTSKQKYYAIGFMSRKDDTDTMGKVDLNNADSLVAQRSLIFKKYKRLASALGISTDQAES